MDAQRYDVVVIGTGPAGEGAAMQAAKSGRSVAVVESFRRVGGGCTHWGTIPSKALRQHIRQLSEFRNNPLFRGERRGTRVEYPEMLRAAEAVISKQVEMRRGFYDRNRVPVVEGLASFVSPHEIEVEDARGARKRVEAEAFIIAVGTRPYRPPDVDFGHPRVLDSDKVLSIRETPRSLTIYGAGVVGCEYASIFRGLDVKINLVNTRKKLLDFLDDEIIDALSYHLRDRGVILRHGEEAAGITADAEGVTLSLKSGKELRTDYLLWANGRTGNTASLGLDKAGVKTDHRGLIVVDEEHRTSAPGIYAAGDVVGFPSLASASYDQGRYAAARACGETADESLVRLIPTGIYTTPEISSVGATERELTEKKVPYEVGHSMFRSLARAQITGRTVGMLKILFHRESLAVLGVHCFGDQAAEIVHIGQIVMSQKGGGNTVRAFVNTTFNYPTMAEAYRVAALNGLNRLA